MFLKFPEEGESFPSCPHGPTILFWKKDKKLDGFYSCSAFRDLKDCPVKIPFARAEDQEFLGQFKSLEYHNGRICDKSQLIGSSYCSNCNTFLKPTDNKSHDSHKVHNNITHENLKDPTKLLLQPTGNDKAEAQYFFDDNTLQLLGKIIKDNGIQKIICVGAPRVHFYIRNRLNIPSFLLDLDERFFNFCDETEFASFNMCNGHFLEGNLKKSKFQEFLKGDSFPLIFLDPPFACRTEPIVHTLSVLEKLYRNINRTHMILPKIWVFPYYFEHYIKNVLPEMEMCDFKVNYTNHKLFSDQSGSRKYGSPIRLFTNIPLELIKLEKGYQFCKLCKKFVSLENKHCNVCRKCPSKNGQTYRHCKNCGTCVKPNYLHCKKCRRCTQKEGHNCKDYVKTLRCWICRETGHNEFDCGKWTKTRDIKFSRGGEIRCLICMKKGHNENGCRRRKELLKETEFLGNVFNCLNKDDCL
ncbi:ZCCHC4 family protein [Megaselia abdita]